MNCGVETHKLLICLHFFINVSISVFIKKHTLGVIDFNVIQNSFKSLDSCRTKLLLSFCLQEFQVKVAISILSLIFYAVEMDILKIDQL